jgi:hypothetical protein
MAFLAAVVCGAWFSVLPPGWHQSGAPRAPVIGGVVPSNTFSWAATPRSVFDLANPLPRDGIYIWVTLNRPRGGPSGPALRPPLQLGNATLLAQEGAPRLPEYRFEGRYRRQYEVTVGVDFGRPAPSLGLRSSADRVLRRLVFPRWTPLVQHRTC